ncbi:MAG: hypothetical protein GAK33_07208 [Burkholderia lata]|uniref:Uncharacterized protein n=1 Tax=Burkholderia lata (strain ATCC 17760 / DSM 23089 / LMG 22485 / NCIMB 9086 / R18194 / 383) TaxID=482957 RepID=A0A833PN74_BURL3|nr:MAG: hypothetical protein GAK33_07208 [Burkholderia lata]
MLTRANRSDTAVAVLRKDSMLTTKWERTVFNVMQAIGSR